MSPKKWENIFYLSLGLVFIAYGLKTVITQEISAAHSEIQGAWALYGDSATILGAVIIFFGAYILWLAFGGKK